MITYILQETIIHKGIVVQAKVRQPCCYMGLNGVLLQVYMVHTGVYVFAFLLALLISITFLDILKGILKYRGFVCYFVFESDYIKL